MPPLTFALVGHRRKPDSGIYFPSSCGSYSLYNSDQVYGMPVTEPVWLAIVYEPGLPCGRVIGRKRSRGGAEKCCRKHARAVGIAARVEKPKRPALNPRGQRKRIEAGIAKTATATAARVERAGAEKKVQASLF